MEIRIGVRKATNDNSIIKRKVDGFDDLEAYLYVVIDSERGVTGSLLKDAPLILGKTEDQLWSEASENVRNHNTVTNLSKFLFGLTGEEVAPLPTWVFTNKEVLYGASIITDLNYIKTFAREMKWKSFAVIPSSIHEVLLMEYNPSEIDEAELMKIIKEINFAEVADDEVLSDHPYIFTV